MTRLFAQRQGGLGRGLRLAAVALTVAGTLLSGVCPAGAGTRCGRGAAMHMAAGCARCHHHAAGKGCAPASCCRWTAPSAVPSAAGATPAPEAPAAAAIAPWAGSTADEAASGASAVAAYVTGSPPRAAVLTSILRL